MSKKQGFRINLGTKFSAASILLALVLCIGITIVSYVSYKNAMVKKYTDTITALAATAGDLVSADKVADYMASGEVDDEYLQLYELFKIIQRENHLEFLSAYVPHEDGLHVFVQGTEETDPYHFNLGTILGLESYPQEDIDGANALFTNPDHPKIVITSGSEFGYLITAFKVLYDSNNEPALVIAADMSMEDVNDNLRSYLILVIILAVFIIALFVTLYIILLRIHIISPLQVLVDSAIKFVHTGYDEEHGGQLQGINVNLKTGDEIQDLAEAFNKMTDDIVTYMNELTTATSERERVETELRVATLIQEGMLPREFSVLGHSEVEIFASMRAAKNVGGDFYDFFFIDDNHFCIVIGDVSGKGVPAALFMAMAKATIRDLVLQKFPVNEALIRANNSLCKNNDQGMFVTLYVATIDLETGELVWSDAGHSPAVLWSASDGSVKNIIGKKGFVAGGMEDYQYKMNSTFIQPDDIIYIYTDGVNEAINPQEELYGEEYLLKFIESQRVREVEILCKEVVKDVDRHAGEEPQFDDITMLAVKYKGFKNEAEN